MSATRLLDPAPTRSPWRPVLLAVGIAVWVAASLAVIGATSLLAGGLF